MRVAVYTITKATTDYRVDVAMKSLGMLRRWAGVQFDHYVFDNGSTPEFQRHLYKEQIAGRLHYVYMADENFGQNIGANWLLEQMDEVDYDWIVRWDDDCIPDTRRFLKKMIHRLTWLQSRGLKYGIGYPNMQGLNNPVPTQFLLEHPQWPIEVVDIAGQCRVHPAAFFDGWQFNEYGALGFGEATEVADRIQYLRHVKKEQAAIMRFVDLKVKHGPNGTAGQERDDPEYHGFEQKVVPRYVGYGL